MSLQWNNSHENENGESKTASLVQQSRSNEQEQEEKPKLRWPLTVTTHPPSHHPDAKRLYNPGEKAENITWCFSLKEIS